MGVRCRVDTVKAFAIILLIRPLFLASHSVPSIWSADNWVSGTSTWHGAVQAVGVQDAVVLSTLKDLYAYLKLGNDLLKLGKGVQSPN